ncbi:unnamed protein product [Darwinula stevensoni]|uniref:Sodium/potassium-transporting ATPase subunit beta-2 n=1 Tax=Darwinula stevensoni TaxID=69355 RepID=A0A7R8X409_9CRUS|nr:unnamed protein product [Darwinula stevensoni]CAG0885111.1 unnamed protein product [Darwinula stevensoni]
MGKEKPKETVVARPDEFYRKPPEYGRLEGFLKFLYNPDDKSFLGRTCESWAKIFIFYVIFYACLTAFWSLMLYIVLQTLPENSPTFLTASSIIGDNPGLGFRPRPPDEQVDSTLVMFSKGREEGYTYWVSAMDEYLKAYDVGDGHDENSVNCSFNNPPKEGKVCRFPLSELGSECTKEEKYGYSIGKPCIVIKLNKIFGWKPEPYTSLDQLQSDMPEALKEVIKADAEKNNGTLTPMVWMSCHGENPADKENIGPIHYYPHQGFPAYYFPYMNQAGYHTPLVALIFQQPNSGVLINIECQAWDQKIVHARQERIGSVHFELLVDQKIFGWKPEPYTSLDQLQSDMPEALKEVIKADAEKNNGTLNPMVWMSCHGENPADKENIGPIHYYPHQGFPAYYFPYMNQAGYHTPLVALIFQQPNSGVLINIECQAWDQKIVHARQERIGSVHFELLVDQKVPKF